MNFLGQGFQKLEHYSHIHTDECDQTHFHGTFAGGVRRSAVTQFADVVVPLSVLTTWFHGPEPSSKIGFPLSPVRKFKTVYRNLSGPP